MVLNKIGRVADKYWMEIQDRFEYIKLDEFVIMPNHIHGIICITCRYAINRVSTGGITKNMNPMLSISSLSKIIRWYKGRCTFEIRKHYDPDFAWQPRFYDHIIRNEFALESIQNYTRLNPEKWNKNQGVNDEDNQVIFNIKKTSQSRK